MTVHQVASATTPDGSRTDVSDISGTHALLADQDDECLSCAVLRLQLWVSLNATFYVALRIKPAEFRLVVVEDVARAWLRCVEDGDHADGFAGFFSGYCQRVEEAVDASLCNSPGHDGEYQRVWMEHALALLDLHDGRAGDRDHEFAA